MAARQAPYMSLQLFPHVRTTNNQSGEINNLVAGLDREVYIVSVLGYSPNDIVNQFDLALQNTAVPGKIQIARHEIKLRYTNHYTQPCEIEFYELVAKSDIPASVGSSAGTIVTNLIAMDTTTAVTNWDSVPFGKIGYRPWLSEGLKQYFTIRRVGSKKLLAGQTTGRRYYDSKPYSFSRPKFYQAAADYGLYKGNRILWATFRGSPSVSSIDITRTECSYGAMECSFYLQEAYDTVCSPYNNNIVGYNRGPTPSTSTLANTVTWHPAISSGALSSGAQGIN